MTLLVVGQHGLVGPELCSPVDASYLSDSILLLRSFAAGGRAVEATLTVEGATIALWVDAC